MNGCFIPPSGHSEADVLAAIDHVAVRLAKSMSFGYFAPDDIRQEARIYALELLRKGTYDPSRPLVGYLFTHVKRRLLNLRRNKLFRNDPPCRACADGNHCTGSGPCRAQAEWEQRNARKATLMNSGVTAEAESYRPVIERDSNVEKSAQGNDLAELIDARLPVGLRQDYTKMLAGERVTTGARRRVQEAILDIMDDAGLPLDGLVKEG